MSTVKTRYLEIQDELSKIHSNKIEQYGINRYEKHSDQFNYWMCFSDMYRKTLRLERLTEKATKKSSAGELARDKLIDDYKDIANYAIMAIQILEEKDDDQDRSDSNARC